MTVLTDDPNAYAHAAVSAISAGTGLADHQVRAVLAAAAYEQDRLVRADLPDSYDDDPDTRDLQQLSAAADWLRTSGDGTIGTVAAIRKAMAGAVNPGELLLRVVAFISAADLEPDAAVRQALEHARVAAAKIVEAMCRPRVVGTDQPRLPAFSEIRSLVDAAHAAGRWVEVPSRTVELTGSGLPSWLVRIGDGSAAGHLRVVLRGFSIERITRDGSPVSVADAMSLMAREAAPVPHEVGA